MAKNYSLGGVINELREIEKINGATRKVKIVVDNHLGAAEYADYVNDKPLYKFSDGDGAIMDTVMRSRKIRKSINKLASVSGGKYVRRKEAELDELTILMAKRATKNIRDFIKTGGNHVYQHWKGTDQLNLWETGNLWSSVGWVVTKKGKVYAKGRSVR